VTTGVVPMGSFGGRVDVHSNQPFPRGQITAAVNRAIAGIERLAEFDDGRIDPTSLTITITTLNPVRGQLHDRIEIQAHADVEVPR
jgi:hypothetical protein